MGIQDKFVGMLRCPIDGMELRIADDTIVERLNRQIAAGELRDQLDQRISEPIEAGLITTDKKRIYPIRGGIPSMVADESITL